LKTGRSRGHLKKTVRVYSNDPNRPLAYLRVEADISFEGGEKNFSFNMTNVRSREKIVREIAINVNPHHNTEVEKIETSSEYISVKRITPEDTTVKHDSLRFEITLGPGLEPGLMSQRAIIHFKNSALPRAQIYFYGIVVEDIEFAPLRLTYIVSDTVLDTANQSRKVMVTNYRDDLPLEIVDINTPGDNLDFDIKTLEEGRKFEITATANEKILAVDSLAENRIVIYTNNPEMRQLKVPYRVVRR